MRLSYKQPFFIWRLTAIAAMLFGCANFIFAQTPPPAPPAPPAKPSPTVSPAPRITVPRVTPPVRSVKRQVRNESDTPAEKSIATDAKVTISLCVSEGKIKVNGWERSEIRAFVNEGSELGFKVLQKNRQSEKPGWVQVLGFDPAKSGIRPDECLFGEDIELDVPRNATVNIRSRASETVINSVGKVTVENVGGDIFLSEIAQGVDAKTHEGDVTVEKSGGAITLSSIVGNILAFDVSPSEIGDIFKAKTSNGAIVIQKVEHRQMDVSSNSGSIKFDGEFLGGGQYNFGTQNGSIMLTIPQTSSCKVNASYGFGSFNSEIPMQNVVNPSNAQIRNLSGVIGKGDATVTLRTYTGRIEIKPR